MFTRLFLLALLCASSLLAKTPEQEIYVKADGAELFCRVLGEGDPIILVHGGPGLGQDYLLPHMERLAQKHRVIFYDQRACGRSTGQATRETMIGDCFAKDLEAVRKALQLDKVTVIGHSWGGYVAMKYALDYPQHVQKLVLLNTLPASMDGVQAFRDHWHTHFEPYQEELLAFQNAPEYQANEPKITEEYMRFIFRYYCYKPASADLLNLSFTPETATKFKQVFMVMHNTVFAEQFDFHDGLSKLEAPTLIIHGQADIIPSDTITPLHESLQNSKYHLMPDCGHFPFVEEPETFFALLEDFLC